MPGPALNALPGGKAELTAVVRSMRGAMVVAFVFSAFVNILMLSAPLYMLQVHDRVLASRSVPTLVTLTLLLLGLFVVMGVLDHARGRLMARFGARFQARLEGRVIGAGFSRLCPDPQDKSAWAADQDLDAMARFWASPGVLAFFDLPWTPIFFAALFVFHTWLGVFAVAGALILVVASWANHRATELPLQLAVQAGRDAERTGAVLKQDAEVIRALGMTGAAIARWQVGRAQARGAALAAADAAGGWSVAIRTFRLFLQSAMLGLAALLVIADALSAGAMVAATILLGRALQPIEQTVAHWASFTRAAQARRRLLALLDQVPVAVPRIELPRPTARLGVEGLTVIPPGSDRPTLHGVSFALQPGQVMGVIGASGAGKSTLAKALIGIYPPESGQIRLDGATLDQYAVDRLGRWIGYLPQRVSLFDGTVAENIARLQPDAAPQDVIAAARAAAAHEMILTLPQGYDTPVWAAGSRLSGGQMQRIGLARAIFGDPVLIVLDEPNAHLDNTGTAALNQALRLAKANGTAVLIMAHRPAALQECDLLMVLKDGAVATLGPRDQVLREALKNAGDVARTLHRGVP